ncbi:LptF/LptG family permease [Hyphococcus sp.]|uniref:LptF/LptG family permease n=1 Tax=Hyphococcus sp. TaxID=2038636 RepID=UPI002089F668|nr:MAG: LPS export ABC transporter permease LptF [Marinicaulis sp.]
MSSLDKYLLRQCLTPFALILLVTTMIVWMTQTLQRIDIIVEHGQGLGVFMMLSVLIIPSLLAVIIPFALFGAVVYTLHRLHSDSEIAVMFAAGVSRWRIAAPLLLITTFVALATLYVNVDLMPRTYRVMKQMVVNIRADFASSLLRSGEFIEAADGFTIYVDQVLASNQFAGLLVNDYRNPEEKRTYIAQRAAIQETSAGPLLLLKNGSVQSVADYTGKVDIIQYQDWAIDISSIRNGSNDLQLEMTERYLGELLNPDMTKDYDRLNASKLIAEGHARLAAPLYAFAYVMIGLYSLIGGAYTRRSYFIRVAMAGAAIFALRFSGFLVQGFAGTSGEMWLLYALPLAAIGSAGFLLFSPPASRRSLLKGAV